MGRQSCCLSDHSILSHLRFASPQTQKHIITIKDIEKKVLKYHKSLKNETNTDKICNTKFNGCSYSVRCSIYSCSILLIETKFKACLIVIPYKHVENRRLGVQWYWIFRAVRYRYFTVRYWVVWHSISQSVVFSIFIASSFGHTIHSLSLYNCI